MRIFVKLISVALFILSMNNACASEHNTTIPVAILMYLLDDVEEFVCNDSNDTDNDRLLNCVETNSNVYVSRNNTGTDPNNPDTDGDGINDGDEVLGTIDGLDLPSMGVNPLRKNILIEYDWFEDDVGSCGSHSHRPTEAVINAVSTAFANAPIYNPDGTIGITIIQDYGQEIEWVFNGGNVINDSDGVITDGVNDTEFNNHKIANFADNRHGYFHYVIMPHQYNNGYSSGQAELPGDDLIVSLGCYFDNTAYVANTIMHELGHNLNLRHGGDENCNKKPNYNSIMNYKYQFYGVDGDCDSQPDGILDYSLGSKITLDESNLNENNGTCGSPLSIDWNGNSVFEVSVSEDLNQWDCSSEHPDQAYGLSVLNDYNDWENIQFGLGLTDADGATVTEIIDCQEPPSE